MNQVYIINKFDPKKLYPSKKALRELERMYNISINANRKPWSKRAEKIKKFISAVLVNYSEETFLFEWKVPINNRI